MNGRLGVLVAAMLLGAHMGAPAEASDPSVDELMLISDLIDAGDIESLIMYLLQNPHLMDGDTPLARRLREFLIAAENLSDFLAFDTRLRSALARDLGDSDVGGLVTAPDEGSSIY